MKRIVFLCALAAVLAASFVSAGAADKQVTLSGHPSPHTIPTYVALRKGWFEEQGLDVELLIYISGPPQMEGCGELQGELRGEVSPDEPPGGGPCSAAGFLRARSAQ